MANIVYRQMPAPTTPPPPPSKAKTPGWGKCLVQIPGGERGRMVMDELIPAFCAAVIGKTDLNLWTP